MPLLEGLDGVEKMSKSLGNYVGIEETPREIFGKILSISDPLMWRYYELCTDLRPAQIEELKRKVASGEVHPKRAKSDLARRIITDFHSAEAAAAAEEEFERIFVSRETPDEVEEVVLPCDPKPIWLPRLLVTLHLARSHGEATRLIQQGGVTLDGNKVESAESEVKADRSAVHLLKVGKRRFLRVRFQ
jgi:tyrosyl-tRNA synthetase